MRSITRGYRVIGRRFTGPLVPQLTMCSVIGPELLSFGCVAPECQDWQYEWTVPWNAFSSEELSVWCAKCVDRGISCCTVNLRGDLDRNTSLCVEILAIMLFHTRKRATVVYALPEGINNCASLRTLLNLTGATFQLITGASSGLRNVALEISLAELASQFKFGRIVLQP